MIPRLLLYLHFKLQLVNSKISVITMILGTCKPKNANFSATHLRKLSGGVCNRTIKHSAFVGENY